MPDMFKSLRRRRRAKRPYPADGEMASISRVAALDRATGPLIARLLASPCHVSRQTHRIDESTPLLPDTLACLERAVEAKHAGGDHLIVIGRVKCIHMRHESSPGPLLFYRGRYRQIDMSARMPTGFDEDRFIHGW